MPSPSNVESQEVETLLDLYRADIQDLVTAKLALQTEVAALRDRVALTEGVVKAAVAWRDTEYRSREGERAEGELWAAVDLMQDREYDAEQRRKRRDDRERAEAVSP